MDPPTQGESSSLGEAQDISFIKEFVHSSQRGKEPLTVERVLETSTREQEERVEPSEIGELQDLSPRRVRKYGLPSSATMGSHATPTVVTASVPAKGHVPALLMAPGSYGGEGQQELPVGSLDVKDVSDHLTEDSGGVDHHILGGTLPVPPPDNMSDTCGYARRNSTSPTLVSQGGHRESLALPVTLDSSATEELRGTSNTSGLPEEEPQGTGYERSHSPGADFSMAVEDNVDSHGDPKELARPLGGKVKVKTVVDTLKKQAAQMNQLRLEMLNEKEDVQATLQRLALRLEALASPTKTGVLQAQLQGLLEQQQELRNNQETTKAHLEYRLQGLYSDVQSMGHLPEELPVLYEDMKKLINTKAEQSLCAPTKVQEQLDSMQHDLKTLKDPMRVLKFTATGMENPDKGTPSPYLLLERTPPELEELKMVEKEAIMYYKDASEASESGPRGPSARVPLLQEPCFDGSNFLSFCRGYKRWLILTDQATANSLKKSQWLIQFCSAKVQTAVEKTFNRLSSGPKLFDRFLDALHTNYPSVDTDASLREELLALRPLGSTPTTDQVQELITAWDEVRSKMSPGSMSQQEELIYFQSRVPKELLKRLRDNDQKKHLTERLDTLQALLRHEAKELTKEAHADRLRDSMLERLCNTPLGKSPRNPSPPIKTPKEAAVNSLVEYVPSYGTEGSHWGEDYSTFNWSQQPNRGEALWVQETQAIFTEEDMMAINASVSGKGKTGKKPTEEEMLEYNMFRARIMCGYCGKKGHFTSWCWKKQNDEQGKGKAKGKGRGKGGESGQGRGGRGPQGKGKGTAQESSTTLSGEDIPPPPPMMPPLEHPVGPLNEVHPGSKAAATAGPSAPASSSGTASSMTVHPAASNMSIDREPRGDTTNDGPDKKRTRFNFLKEELVNLLGANLLTLDIVVGGQTVEAFLDTGATICAVAASIVPPCLITSDSVSLLRMGDGHRVMTQGMGRFHIPFDNGEIVSQDFTIFDTTAFKGVVGLNFLLRDDFPRFKALELDPPALIFENASKKELRITLTVPTTPPPSAFGFLHASRFKTENYRLDPRVQNAALSELGKELSVDLFANALNHTSPLWCGKSHGGKSA